jgi:hypothetical protein
MIAHRWSNIAAVAVAVWAHGARAEDKHSDLTLAGQAILAGKIAVDGQPSYGGSGPTKPLTSPLAMCAFPGGLCGAVNRDGTTAVPPRYDWVGTFSDGRAAVRLGGL